MKSVKLVLAILVGATIVVSTASVHAADGMVLEAKHLPAVTASELRGRIEKQRVSDAAAFRAVHDLAARSKDLDKRARGGKAPIALQLKGMGAPAVLPLIELLAFDRPSDVPAGVTRDLVEGLGLLRDARSMPVLGAILDHATDASMTRTAAEAIARLESDDATRRLDVALGSADASRRAAILAGMGASHREATVRTLAAKLADRSIDEASARAAIKSLGRAGNAWVWPTLPQKSEGPAARAASAKALVAAFVAYEGDLQQEASDALMMVDDPSTPSLVADAKRTASPKLAASLDALAARFANNPARTR